jgi:hypothetical protein
LIHTYPQNLDFTELGWDLQELWVSLPYPAPPRAA